jgi:hypothetical protein
LRIERIVNFLKHLPVTRRGDYHYRSGTSKNIPSAILGIRSS